MTQLQTTPVKDATACEFKPHGCDDVIKLSLSIVQKLVAVPTKSGKTCSERDALKFIAMCRARRLNPFEGDAFLVGYDKKDGTTQFSLITAHQAFLKRAETHDDFEGMESGIILINEETGEITEREGDFHLLSEKVAGGWCRVHRKGRRPIYKRLSFEQRMPSYETPFWQGNKGSEQIVKCAESDALRASFPTMLGGLYVREESGSAAFEAAAHLVKDEPAPKQVGETSTRPDGYGAPYPQGKPEVGAAKNANEELGEVIIAAGFTFDQFSVWALQTNNVPGIESYSSFDEIPVKDARRILRNTAGVIADLEKQRAETGGAK